MSDPYMEMPDLDGAAFKMEGDEVAFLLVHGFTATTTEVRTLAEFFHAKGHTVAAPLLPGHGTHPDDLNRVRWQEWYESARQAYLELRRSHSKIWLGGESMGALLCLKLAVEFPEAAGLLLFAPALKVRLLVNAYWLQFFKKYLRKNSRKIDMPWKGYNVYPLKGAVQLLELQKHIRRLLPEVKQPTFIAVSKTDPTVRLSTGDLLYHSIASAQKELLILQHSPHVMLLGPEAETLFAQAGRFFAENN